MSAATKPGDSKVQSAGCYKCGKKGHWSRDCPAPPEDWVNKGSWKPPADRTAGENDPSTAPPAPLLAAAAKQQKKRPKVTLELLKEPSGIPDVYHNFPKICSQQFRGPGHEVADLRRLLEMYKRWQDRIFPHADFDRFIVDVEKLSGSNVLKHELQDMRMSLLKVAQEAAAPPMEADWAADEEQERASPVPAAPADEDHLMVDDDELLELAAQLPLGTSAPSLPSDDELMQLVLGSEEQQELAGGGESDEELVQLAACEGTAAVVLLAAAVTEDDGQQVPYAVLAAPQQLHASDFEDDDELLALALAGSDSCQPLHPISVPAGLEQQPAGLASTAIKPATDALEDSTDGMQNDEVLKLAFGDD